MSFYGKLAGALVSAAIIGGGAAYVADVSSDVMKEVTDLSSEISCYTIKQQGGTIALYKDGSPEPLAVYDMPVCGINAADSELLQEGIRLQGLSEVMRLLEDLDVDICAE